MSEKKIEDAIDSENCPILSKQPPLFRKPLVNYKFVFVKKSKIFAYILKEWLELYIFLCSFLLLIIALL